MTAQWVLIGVAAAGLLGAIALSVLIVVFGIIRPLGRLVGVLPTHGQGRDRCRDRGGRAR